jgi:hypothetical protein
MRRRCALVVAGLMLLATMATGQNVFYAVTGQGTGTASSLFTINPANGAATLVGATGFNGVGSLAFSPGGVLYAVANGGVPPRRLITINTSTGAGTAVGPTGATSNITDIAFRSDGVLFAQSGQSNFYTINTSTGAATSIAAVGGTIGGGLAFNASNTLYLADDDTLVTVNTANGNRTTVAAFGFVGGTDAVVGMKFHPSTGVLYGVAWALDSGTPSLLVSINTTTGAMTSLGSTGQRLEALAIGGAAQPPPPVTPIPSSLWMLLTGLFSLAIWMYWRKSEARG